jgi:protein ImuB
LPDVRAALPALIVRPAEAVNDAEALLALARWLGCYGPATNIDGLDGVWVDVTGVPHLFGGEMRLCADLAVRFARLGITARIGMADTLGAAHALARFGISSSKRPWAIAASGDAKTALHDLPVSSLRLAPEAVRLLTRLGLKRIGQLYGIPRAALAARFRAEMRKDGRATADATAAELLLRLDQALGVMREPRPPLFPPPLALSRFAFSEPLLTAEGVEQALERLADDLMAKLAEQGLGARRFRLALYRTDGTVAEAIVGTSRPSRNPVHVRRLMIERLADLDAGFGIDVVTLEAAHLASVEDAQIGLEAAGTAGDDDIAALVDRLVNHLGSARVRSWSAQASHIPERAEVWRPAMDVHLETMQEQMSPTGGGVLPKEEAHGVILRHLPRRPPVLLAPPEPIVVIAEVPEGAPQQFIWRRVPRRIVRSEGPERIAPEWWRHIGSTESSPGTRDYYRLEDATGARYWVFREGLYATEDGEIDDADDDAKTDDIAMTPRWFLHGLFG